MFIRWILLFFSSQPNKSTTSLEELDDNALPHDDDDNSSIQQDSNTPPLHHSPKDCILFLDQVKAHLQTSIMNEFFSSPIGGDEWPWNQQNQHHLMRAVVSVVQVFCLANMMSRILSSCLCNNNSTMDKVLDEVEHTFSDLVIARCVQQIKTPGVLHLPDPLWTRRRMEYFSSPPLMVTGHNHLEDVLRSIRIEYENNTTGQQFSPCSLLFDSLSQGLLSLSSFKPIFEHLGSNRIEEIWLQYCNACFDLLVSNVRNSTSPVLLKRELEEKMLCKSSCIEGTMNRFIYEELLDDLPCFVKLDMELNV
ncbi:hypothetical protein FDP41_008944 [Naegleria fowleri]|uniref:Uncharacterized protein n=1 Tax=Naegleria fowleri TaxID=5763 RepID=A0A6A5BF90_NAEFO|nr:uncharacterized protein FDP41_008944 [Naegleria fowleri]KAF0972695.1 hypothetical protein FDP41_008944 [Naegleria fowleri]CAG4715587.1 unnamed protein product [Naegleria fowleri]